MTSLSRVSRKVGDGKGFISNEDMNTLGSIRAEQAAPTVSGKYRMYKTEDVVKVLGENGWLPVMAQEQRAVKVDNEGFQKHLVRFRMAEQSALTQVGDVLPEMILVNSHNGTSAYTFMAGLFHLACLNGLIVSDATVASIRIRHVGYNSEEVIEATKQITSNVPKIMGKVGLFKSIPLNLDESLAFAESALIAKFAEDDSKVEHPEYGYLSIDDRYFSTKNLVNPYRAADEAKNLWNVLNIVQEKLLTGSRFEIAKGRRVRVRGITSINENVRVNRALWHLAEEMARIKTNTVA